MDDPPLQWFCSACGQEAEEDAEVCSVCGGQEFQNIPTETAFGDGEEPDQ